MADEQPAHAPAAGPAQPAIEESPSPEVLPPAETAPHAWAEQDPTEFIGADGAVDFDRMFAGANLPHVGFTAEQVAKVLAALPNDLPMQVKRLTLKATLEAVDRDAVIDPQ